MLSQTDKHLEKYDRRCDAGKHQRQIAVGPALLDAHLIETDGRDLVGDDHDSHDEGKGQLFQPEVVCIDAVCRQGGKVGGQQRRAGGDDEAVEHAPEPGL